MWPNLLLLSSLAITGSATGQYKKVLAPANRPVLTNSTVRSPDECRLACDCARGAEQNCSIFKPFMKKVPCEAYAYWEYGPYFICDEYVLVVDETQTSSSSSTVVSTTESVAQTTEKAQSLSTTPGISARMAGYLIVKLPAVTPPEMIVVDDGVASTTLGTTLPSWKDIKEISITVMPNCEVKVTQKDSVDQIALQGGTSGATKNTAVAGIIDTIGRC